MTTTPFERLLPLRWPVRMAVVTLMLATSVTLPRAASAQTAAVLYERAQTRAASAQNSPSLANLRAAVKAYELVPLQYPRSGYCDDALWNGALVARQAWEKFQQPADLTTATRLLNWLRREYPSSPWKAKAATELASLSQRPKPTAAQKPAVTQKAAAAATAPPTAPAAVSPSAVDLPVATIRGITRSPLPEGDRLTIEIDREVLITPERITDPDRLFFDLRDTQFETDVAAALDNMSSARLTTVRIGRQDATTTRVVLELAGAPRHSVFALYHPYRIVVDVEGGTPPTVTTPAAGALPTPAAPPKTASAPASLPPAPPSATSAGDYSLARQLGLGVSRIVIDAGHGGHDPGAQANGLVEADLVLDIARRVEVLLKKQPGIDVVLTRSTNVFIPLEERTAIATREGADLFLSIHANASRRVAAQGVETYFLNFSTNADAEAVAARENSGSRTSMAKLPELVQQIALHDKMRESREFAQMVQTNLVRAMRTQNKNVVDLGVKQAPFVVLIGAKMPSVLAELSFITNKAEAALLKKDAYRQRIAQSLADAVIKYQASLKKVTTEAAGSGR